MEKEHVLQTFLLLPGLSPEPKGKGANVSTSSIEVILFSGPILIFCSG